MGLAFHFDSALLRGIRLRAQQTTLDQTHGVILCARSENDTQNNPHNPMYGIAATGADGELLTLVGTENSDSGGRSIVPMSMFDPAIRPTKVDQPERRDRPRRHGQARHHARPERRRRGDERRRGRSASSSSARSTRTS